VIDHVTLRVDELGASRRFYAHALELLDGPSPTEGGGFPPQVLRRVPRRRGRNVIEAVFHDRRSAAPGSAYTGSSCAGTT